MLRIEWTDKESGGYVDLIPDEWFEDGRNIAKAYHDVVGPRDGTYQAVCAVGVSDGILELDYAQFPENEPDWYLGQLRIVYSSASAKSVSSVSWRGRRAAAFSERRIKFVWEDDDLHPDIAISSLSVEGKRSLKAHVAIERISALAKRKREAVLKETGALKCEACSFDYEEVYGPLGRKAAEVHHTRPLHAGERITRLADLAILCSNCHRMIHRLEPIPSVAEFAENHVKKTGVKKTPNAAGRRLKA